MSRQDRDTGHQGPGGILGVLFVLLALVTLLATACEGDGEADDATAAGAAASGEHSAYALVVCSALSENLDAGLASIATYGDALESESVEERAEAVEQLLSELADQSAELLDQLNAADVPTGDEPFADAMEDGERDLQDVLSDGQAAAGSATSQSELDGVLEAVLGSLGDETAKFALTLASDDLDGALRTEASCAPLF